MVSSALVGASVLEIGAPPEVEGGVRGPSVGEEDSAEVGAMVNAVAVGEAVCPGDMGGGDGLCKRHPASS